MQAAAYKNLFSHPRMVEDLLHGFVARDWSDALDFSTLERLPEKYVTDLLCQRPADLTWRVRYREETWLYLPLMLEVGSTTANRYMAVDVMTYCARLYEELIRRGEVGDDGPLPPVLPVVLYNGRERWTAPVEVGDLIAPAGEAPLAPLQPSHRYFLFDIGAMGERLSARPRSGTGLGRA